MLPDIAPVVLFVYNRPDHTKKTLEALANNLLAKESVLYIYCDGVPENATEELKNNNTLVKKVIREQQWCKDVIIFEAESNKGLAKSVIQGVESVVNKHGKIIVLEDDLITSTYFLEFMNKSLNMYENDNRVIQISGFSFPAQQIESKESSYFLSITSTWGWATWKRAWDTLDFECKDYGILKKDKTLARKFNCNGSYNYTKMFFKQMEQSKISSWGIRFYWNAFKKNSLTLYPDYTLVLNNGWDSSGRHKDNYDVFPLKNWNLNYRVKNFPNEIKLDSYATNIIYKYLKKRTSVFTKIISKLNFLS